MAVPAAERMANKAKTKVSFFMIFLRKDFLASQIGRRMEGAGFIGKQAISKIIFKNPDTFYGKGFFQGIKGPGYFPGEDSEKKDRRARRKYRPMRR
jgi:hypothetical protein